MGANDRSYRATATDGAQRRLSCWFCRCHILVVKGKEVDLDVVVDAADGTKTDRIDAGDD